MQIVWDKLTANRAAVVAAALLSMGAATAGCMKSDSPDSGANVAPGAPGTAPQLPRGADPRAEVPPPGQPRPMSGTH